MAAPLCPVAIVVFVFDKNFTKLYIGLIGLVSAVENAQLSLSYLAVLGSL